MSIEHGEQSGQAQRAGHELKFVSSAYSCELDAEGHCITCSDEALPARIVSIDEVTGLALVNIEDTTEEIDITFVEDVVPGDVVLVHGGVAIAHQERSDE